MANKYAPIVEKLQGSFSDQSVSRPPLTEAHLNKIEAQLGYKLPADYREFLRDYAGVRLSRALYPVQEDGFLSEEMISGFSGSTEEQTLADSHHDVLKNFTEGDPGDGTEVYPGIHLVRDDPTPFATVTWPAELLGIGWDPGGNTICLALFGLRLGAVFYWRNAPHPDSQNLYLIADSFDGFMNLLSSTEIWDRPNNE